MVSDRGLQFSPLKLSEFSKIVAEYEFKHITSKPKFAQSNGFVESAIKFVKCQQKKFKDPYMALPIYRTTPLKMDSVLLIYQRKGRCSCTKVLIIYSNCIPSLPDMHIFKKEGKRKSWLLVSKLFSLRATLTPPLSPTGQDLASSSYQHTVVFNYMHIFVSGLAGEFVAGPHRGPDWWCSRASFGPWAIV